MDRIEPQSWMSAPETLAVVEALSAGGSEVRFVGGCLRDALMGRQVTDIDIATPDPPARVIELLTSAGLKAVPTGIEHGTVTAVAHHRPFEITTLRHDVETYGRRAKVAFTDDWVADAARRDFTFNALSCTLDGRLYDPFGGRADLAQGRVRFVGRAEDRIREDVLRLLRFFRFYAHYGKPPPDEEALAAAHVMAPLLPTLSGERIAKELLKLLAAPDPAAVLILMREQAVLMHVLPEATHFERLARLVEIENAEGINAEAPRRLAALLAGSEAVGAVAGRLRLPNAMRDRMEQALLSPRPMPEMSAAKLRALRYRLKAGSFLDRALIAAAENSAPVTARREVFALTTWQPPQFPVRARDALVRGGVAGPELGLLMKELEQWWVAGDYPADRDPCLAELERRLKG
jgi:poly(A) polymerase